MNPNHPVYVISKGRWKTPLTARALNRLQVPFRLVVEPQEAEQYAAVCGEHGTLTPLPFSNLGQGSIPARNWVWEHARENDAPWHWILDDNIGAFNRLNRNLQVQVTSGTIFRCAEDFVDRYENVAQAGFQYDFFAKSREQLPPFVLNTRIYSCILIRTSVPFRWRGRYNEDTDLSLRLLKAGWCTVLFNAFIQEKAQTMTMKGGNTDELYAGEGRRRMAEELVAQHPDVARVSWKFNRWQHHVDYSQFKRNALRLRAGVTVRQGVNNYGMALRRLREDGSFGERLDDQEGVAS